MNQVESRREAARRPDGKFGYQGRNLPAGVRLYDEDDRENVTAAKWRFDASDVDNARFLYAFAYDQAFLGAHRFARGHESAVRMAEIRDEIAGWVLFYVARHQKTHGYVSRHGIRMAMLNAVSRLRIVEEVTGSIYGDPNKVLSSTISARKALHNEFERIRREEGKEPSPARKKAIARALRDNWEDVNHRPSLEAMLSSIRYEKQSEEWTLAAQIDAHSATRAPDIDLFSDVDVDSLNKREATRLYISRMLADTRHGEGILKRDMSYRLSRKLRKTVDDSGRGVIAILHQWERAEDDEVTDAFWAPFHDLSDRHKTHIAELFYSHGDKADELWRQCLTSATKSNR